MCMNAGVHKVQKRRLDPLKLELETVVSYLMWVLGIKFRSFVRAVHALSH